MHDFQKLRRTRKTEIKQMLVAFWHSLGPRLGFPHHAKLPVSMDHFYTQRKRKMKNCQ